MKVDVQTACALAQMGALAEARIPCGQGGWSEELDIYAQMASEFEEQQKAKGSSYYPDYYQAIDDWYEELDKFWDANKHRYLKFPDGSAKRADTKTIA